MSIKQNIQAFLSLSKCFHQNNTYILYFDLKDLSYNNV